MSLKCSGLFIMLCMLSACAPQSLPPWEGEPVTAQFTARVLPQAADMPLQGGLRMQEGEGSMGIIFQHGRTLGQCTLQARGAETRLRLHCRAAEGLGSQGTQLLQRAALAAYRALHWLRTQGSPGSEEQGWRVFSAPCGDRQPLAYEDSAGTVHIVFTEVAP